MSITYTKAVWKLNLQNSGLKLVALALADMADEKGKCWPSAQTLAGMCEMDDRSIRRHIMRLRALRLLTTSPRFEDGRQRSNVYQFVRVDSSVNPDTQVKPDSSVKVDTGVMGGMTPMSGGGGHGCHTEPSYEPSMEPSTSTPQPPKGGEESDLFSSLSSNLTPEEKERRLTEARVEAAEMEKKPLSDADIGYFLTYPEFFQMLPLERRAQWWPVMKPYFEEAGINIIEECPEPKLTQMEAGHFLNHPEDMTDEECEKYWPYLEQYLDGRLLITEEVY